MEDIFEIIGERNLVQIVPSKWMREYLRDKKEFTDREKATLIWNVPNAIWRDRIDSLSALASQTKDDILYEQITSRIKYEQKSYAFFNVNFKKEEIRIIMMFLRENFVRENDNKQRRK